MQQSLLIFLLWIASAVANAKLEERNSHLETEPDPSRSSHTGILNKTEWPTLFSQVETDLATTAELQPGILFRQIVSKRTAGDLSRIHKRSRRNISLENDVVQPSLCPLGHFECTVNSALCVPQNVICNGKPDCPDGSDENNCGKFAWKFKFSLL